MSFSVEGQQQREDRASGSAVEFNQSTVAIREILCNGQAQPGTFRAAGD
jgi:hypothetical protein